MNRPLSSFVYYACQRPSSLLSGVSNSSGGTLSSVSFMNSGRLSATMYTLLSYSLFEVFTCLVFVYEVCGASAGMANERLIAEAFAKATEAGLHVL